MEPAGRAKWSTDGSNGLGSLSPFQVWLQLLKMLFHMGCFFQEFHKKEYHPKTDKRQLIGDWCSWSKSTIFGIII